MKEKEDSFIGVQFPTPKGGVLTVKEGYCSGKHPKYTCECSICSKDEYLWPYGSIQTTKRILNKGSVPCGCAKNPRWKEWQNRIRVQRECDERGYIFHGWYGEYSKHKTLLDLESIKTSLRWHTTILSSFLSGVGNIKEGWTKSGESRSRPDIYSIEKFMETGKFLTGTKFWRSSNVDHKGHKTRWNYTCPVCSNDEYVKAGICSGIFESSDSHLKNGKQSCRCYKGYRWSQEQREYQINKICDDEGLTFVGWYDEDGYVNHSSRVRWLCPDNHKNTSSINNFLRGRRCRTCRDLSGAYNGYYPNRVDEKDYLYIINFNNKYIKVGRSFDTKGRITHPTTGLLYCSGLTIENIKILQTLTSNHQTVYDTEQWLHEELRERGFEYNEHDGLWSTELFDLDCIDVLNYLLKQTDLDVCEDNNLN